MPYKLKCKRRTSLFVFFLFWTSSDKIFSAPVEILSASQVFQEMVPSNLSWMMSLVSASENMKGLKTLYRSCTFPTKE